MAEKFPAYNASGHLTCQIIADACDVLDEMIYPEYQDTLYADDTTWILTSAFIILTMQSGFAMLEIGVSSPGNEVNVMMKNVCDLLFGTIAFFFFGYGIAFGEPSNGFSENFPAMNMNSELANVHVDSTCILSTLQWGWGTSYRRQTSMTPSRVGYSTRDISSILVLPQHLPQSSVVLLQCE